MPVILRPEFEERWLDPETDMTDLEAMLQPYPSEKMEAYEISKYVNNPRNQGIECIQPVDDTIQTTLL
jgi:putative SOS response-associated peptidase YedK